MLADSRTSSRCAPAPMGFALPEGFALPPDICRMERLLSSRFCISQELFTLHGRAAGQSQALMVAQGSWGADAALTAQAAYGVIIEVLKDRNLTMVHERLFGSLAVKEAVMAARAATLSAGNLSPEGAVTYIQGRPPWGEGLAGVILRAVSCRHPQDRVWPIRDQGRTVGRGWYHGGRCLPGGTPFRDGRGGCF